MAHISIADAESLAARALERARASATTAQPPPARWSTPGTGTVSHGLSRVAQYARRMGAGQVDSNATATVRREHGATVIVDAADGLAFPPVRSRLNGRSRGARELGVAVAAVTNSYHFGAASITSKPSRRLGWWGLRSQFTGGNQRLGRQASGELETQTCIQPPQPLQGDRSLRQRVAVGEQRHNAELAGARDRVQSRAHRREKASRWQRRQSPSPMLAHQQPWRCRPPSGAHVSGVLRHRVTADATPVPCRRRPARAVASGCGGRPNF